MTQISDLYLRILSCTACPLRETATAPVVGIGEIGAKYMLIGEAPGRQEDKEGVPFIGYTGRDLDVLITLAKMDKNKCYFTNACRCRPPANRTPRKGEIKACQHWLMEEIRIVKPKIIITLGSTPLSLFSPYGVSQLHGTSFEWEMKE